LVRLLALGSLLSDLRASSLQIVLEIVADLLGLLARATNVVEQDRRFVRQLENNFAPLNLLKDELSKQAPLPPPLEHSSSKRSEAGEVKAGCCCCCCGGRGFSWGHRARPCAPRQVNVHFADLPVWGMPAAGVSLH
jgi:hypothetical protein